MLTRESYTSERFTRQGERRSELTRHAASVMGRLQAQYTPPLMSSVAPVMKPSYSLAK